MAAFHSHDKFRSDVFFREALVNFCSPFSIIHILCFEVSLVDEDCRVPACAVLSSRLSFSSHMAVCWTSGGS